MPARTKRSSAKCTPPLLRNWTGALWPRKKTRSGKILGVMSAALRITSFPSAEGSPAIAVCRCRMENVRSNIDRTTKDFAKRAIETPFGMRASYNISFRPRIRKRSGFLTFKRTEPRPGRGSVVVSYARLRDCLIGRMRMLERRDFMKTCSGMGLAGTLFPGVLWAQARAEGAKKITKEMIESAAAIADVPISEEYKEMMLENLNDHGKGYEEIYKLHIPNSVDPALIFDPLLPGMKFETARKHLKISKAGNSATASAPKNLEDLAFASARELSELVRTKKVSSLSLTEMYLGRLKKYDSTLKFVVTLTEERAIAQAKKADAEIAAGKYRGPLHGLPWGAKDLLATKGYRTTWGAGGFESQMIDEDATVVKRLDEAGAVLVAKLTLGALALGDVWFGGVTRNPWNTNQDRAVPPQVQRLPLLRAAWRSASAPKRSDRFRHRRRAADARDSGRRSAWCQGRERWRSPGAWTSWGRFAEPWKIARSFWTRFMGATAKIAPYNQQLLIGTPIWIGENCASAI